MLSSISKWLRARARSKDDKNMTAASDSKSWFERHQAAVRAFWPGNRIEPPGRKDFLVAELRRAIAAGNDDHAYLLIDVALQFDGGDKVDLLNELLLIQGHRRHQEVVREIQLLANPISVPYLRRALEEGLEQMVEYNGSGSGVVAKWFSHALFDIGTPEAIRVLQMFSAHPDGEVKDEMLYRLGKLSGEREDA